jgi:hypothetical protein
MVENFANQIIRRMVNNEFKKPHMKPDYLVIAIKNNVSLWDNGAETIRSYVDQIPQTFVGMIPSYISKVDEKFGGMTKLTLMWLKEDQTEYYSIIINTPGGYEWIDRQVGEVLSGLGVSPSPI